MMLATLRNAEFKLIIIIISAVFAILLGLCIYLYNPFYTLILIIAYIIIITSTLVILNNHYKHIREITLEVEKVTRGEFKLEGNNFKDGDLHILEFQLYQMSKRIVATIEDAYKEKQILKNAISGLSHQFKTPISVMRTYTDLLLDGAIEDLEVGREFLEKSSLQLDKLERLVLMFLKLSRLEAGISLITKTYNQIDKTCTDILIALSPKISQKNIEVEFNAESTYLHYDAEWLFEALYNIVDNAIQYTPKGGRISILISKTETLTKVEVVDSGIGICEEDIPKVFERFYQGKNAKMGYPNSTGIGLSLAKLIIDKHGAIIKIKSQQGKGTTVIVTLPN